jgi:hypothetical protein
MHIDPKIEKPTRTMLGHAIRGELAELAQVIRAAGDEGYNASIGLCVNASGYIAINAAGYQWPSEAAIREMARHTAEISADYPLSESDIFSFLFCVALGAESLDEVFPDPLAYSTLPVLITGQLLIAFSPRGVEWWDYLDVIWSAIETAETTDLTALPALILRYRKVKTAYQQD